MSKTPQHWKRLFKDQGFSWSFGMRPGDAADFFAPSPGGEFILEHKKVALRKHPDRYLAVDEGAEELVREFSEWAGTYGIISGNGHAKPDLAKLSLQVEPDILLVDAASLRFTAASVCMPSSWSLAYTMGKPVHAVHAAVPGLNQQIGPQIERFLRSIPEGKSFCRANWSITLTDALDYHPDLQRPRPDVHTVPEQLYLRLEHQLFTSLPHGILMGIRIEAIPFKEIRKDPDAWSKLAQTLRTMPDDVAEYKGMRHYRSQLAASM